MSISKTKSTKKINTFKSFGYLALIGVILFSFSCNKMESSSSILEKTKEKINSHTLVTYNYESFWNNRFNDSEFRDTNYIELEKSDENHHGFVFYISNASYLDFFDGITQKEVDGKEGRIINHDSEEIASDSTYFLNRMNLMVQPNHFLNIDSTYENKDSIIEGRNVVIFTTFKDTIYDSDESKFVSSYAIDKKSYEPWFIKTTSITNKDTSQILTHYFQDIEFSNKSIDFDKVRNSISELGYAEIASNQLSDEMEGKQVQIDSKIINDKYENIFDEETTIFGRQGKKTVLMFSFIGCGGCEYAMKEMKKKNFEFKEDIDFYYSSPIDKSAVLQSYLNKKGYDGIGFGKESKMNDNFNAYRYPTFFIIDSSGTVTDVYHGYRNGFENEIF